MRTYLSHCIIFKLTSKQLAFTTREIFFGGQNSQLTLTVVHSPVDTATADVSATLLSEKPACTCLKVVDSVAFTRKWMLKCFFFFFLIGLAFSENYPFLSQLKEDYKQKSFF